MMGGTFRGMSKDFDDAFNKVYNIVDGVKGYALGKVSDFGVA